MPLSKISKRLRSNVRALPKIAAAKKKAKTAKKTLKNVNLGLAKSLAKKEFPSKYNRPYSINMAHDVTRLAKLMKKHYKEITSKQKR